MSEKRLSVDFERAYYDVCGRDEDRSPLQEVMYTAGRGQ